MNIQLEGHSSPWEVMPRGCGIKPLHWGFRRAFLSTLSGVGGEPELFADRKKVGLNPKGADE